MLVSVVLKPTTVQGDLELEGGSHSCLDVSVELEVGYLFGVMLHLQCISMEIEH